MSTVKRTTETSGTDVPSTGVPPYRSYWSYIPKDTLYSLGTTVGITLFSCLSFVVLKSFEVLSSCIRKKKPVEKLYTGKEDLESGAAKGSPQGSRRRVVQRALFQDPPAAGKHSSFSSDAIASSKNDAVDLSDPKELLRVCAIDPFYVVDHILKLLDRDPEQADAILGNLAKKWKGNLEDNYDRTSKQSRSAWVGCFDSLFEDLILTEEQRQFKNRITEGKLSPTETSVMTFTEEQWGKRESIPKREVKVRDLLKQVKGVHEKGEILWKWCYKKILLRGDLFGDLMLNSKVDYVDPRPQGDVEITLGHFFERLLFHRNPQKLNDKLFKEWARFVSGMIRELQLERNPDASGFLIDEYPSIKKLLERLQGILTDEGRLQRFLITTSKLIGIFYPTKRTSPSNSPAK